MSTEPFVFSGTLVLTVLSGVKLRARAPFPRRTIEPMPVSRLRQHNADFFFCADEILVLGGRDLLLLRSLSGRIPAATHRAELQELDQKPNSEQQRIATAIAAFRQAELSLLNGRARHTAQLKEHLRRHLAAPKLVRAAKRFAIAAEVTALRIRKHLSLRAIAQQMCLTTSRIRGIWTRIRNSSGQCIVDLGKKIADSATQARFLEAFFEARKTDSVFLGQTLKVNHRAALALAPPNVCPNFDAFYQAARKSGLRFRVIRYGPHIRWHAPRQHKRAFAELLLHVSLARDKFYLVCIDESAVCPANFQKRQWRARGEPNNTPSRIKYEKLEILGAMSPDGIIALQMITEGFSGPVFAAFARAAIDEALLRASLDQQVVVLLDNAPRHRAKDLLDYCRINQVVLLFNMPHFCELNPIEYAWEFAKREFRSMRDYRKFTQKQGTTRGNHH